MNSFYISADMYDETDQTTFLISHEAAAALLQTGPAWALEEPDVDILLQPVIYQAYTFEVKQLPWSKHNRECFEVVSVWSRHAANVQD
ncbi:unnamed protein product [Linum trigynum]|uniref:Uncharacterized protein n=1 Tax=Linum trigynum TaxID=586398 RepID=A0AAV2FXX0_9ROSI